MTRYISTKETAVLVRQALKNAWPATKFSVRMSRGTASAWMHVNWTDGPTWQQARQLWSQYEGRSFNGMTDGYDDNGTALVVFDGAELPEEVRYSCDGINGHRDYSGTARLHAQILIAATGQWAELKTCTETGEPIHTGPCPEWIAIDGRVYSNLYSPAGTAEQILGRTDLTQLTAQKGGH